MMTELADLGVVELLCLYRSGVASPVEVVQSCLARIDRLDSSVNAVLTLCAESALEAAEESAQRWRDGVPRALEGVPFGLKDVIATAGVRSTGGSRIFADHVPSEDAVVVRRLHRAGAVLLAKLQTFSFALGGPATAFGVTRNPWDLRRTSGGSSSGSAAALASRMLPLAIGSDTGGSVRLPAAFCGVSGLRPTYGRVSRQGVMPLSWTLDTVGPMARSCGDLAAVLPVLSTRRRPATEHHTGTPSGPPCLDGVRVGVPASWFMDRCDPEIVAALATTYSSLTDMGAAIVEVDLPHAHLADAIGRTIVTVEAGSLHEETLDRVNEYDLSLAERILAAREVKAVDYARSLRLLSLLRQDFATVFTQTDVMVTPTAVAAAPLLSDERVLLGDQHIPWSEVATRTTFPPSLAGVPALSTLAGFTQAGLPVGVQIVGAAGQDETCLRVGQAIDMSNNPAAKIPHIVRAQTPRAVRPVPPEASRR